MILSSYVKLFLGVSKQFTIICDLVDTETTDMVDDGNQFYNYNQRVYY